MRYQHPSPVMDITCFQWGAFALTHNFDLFAMKNGSVMWKQDGVRQHAHVLEMSLNKMDIS